MTLKPLKQIQGGIDIGKVVTFDIEAYDWVNPVAVGMYDNSDDIYQQFTGENCVSNFVKEALRRKNRGKTFVAHNGGRYDFIPVISELMNYDKMYDIDILTRGNSPFFVKVGDGEGHRLYFQDSIALIPLSLKEAAKAFAESRKGDFDVLKIAPLDEMDSEDKAEMLEYLEKDCRVLYDILVGFNRSVMQASNGLVKPQMTIASTTMVIFRSQYQDIPLSPDGNAEPAFREAYFGGRTEVFNTDGLGKNLKHYDVNSLYPYCYAKKAMPVGAPRHKPDIDVLDPTKLGVVYIAGKVPKEACNGIPVLPVRAGKKVLFPYGEIEGWYSVSEVRYAINVGALTDWEVLDGWESASGYPFSDFGQELFNKKSSIDKEENPGLYWVFKLFLNSFYGKFGMKREHSAVVIGKPTYEWINGKEIISEELLAKGIALEKTESKAKYIIPRIATEITASARVEMHKWLMKAYENGGSAWYCDTDSIVTDAEMPTGEGLGELDLESVIDSSVFVAPKVYAERHTNGDVTIKVKGIRQQALDESGVDFATFREALWLGKPVGITGKWERPRGLIASIKSGDENLFVKDKTSRSVRNFDQKRNHKESVGATGSAPVKNPTNNSRVRRESYHFAPYRGSYTLSP